MSDILKDGSYYKLYTGEIYLSLWLAKGIFFIMNTYSDIFPELGKVTFMGIRSLHSFRDVLLTPYHRILCFWKMSLTVTELYLLFRTWS